MGFYAAKIPFILSARILIFRILDKQIKITSFGSGVLIINILSSLANEAEREKMKRTLSFYIADLGEGRLSQIKPPHLNIAIKLPIHKKPL